MPGVSLVVGHGGHATTFTALAHGKPLLILPMHPMLDQAMVGASVVEAGAGLMLERSASSEQIATAIRSVLADPRIARSTRAIGDRLRASDASGCGSDLPARAPERKRQEHQPPPGSSTRCPSSGPVLWQTLPPVEQLLTQLDEGVSDGTP